MSDLNQIPTDYKKMFDMTLHKYLSKINRIRTLFNGVEADPGQVTFEYVRKLQTYTDATGWVSFDDPTVIADGSSAPIDSIGTEDATSSPSSYQKAFRLDRRILASAVPIIRDYVAEHTIESVNIIENKVNRNLIANMIANAAQTYVATTTWAAGGDPVADITDAKVTFQKQSGGVEADFIVLNNSQYAALPKDFRFQNTLYTKNENYLETGTIAPKPLGLDIIVDPAMTSGSFLLGKKGMFADLIVTENYKVFERDFGVEGREMQSVFTYVDQYKKPYYLMVGTGI
jgi:hypothetical protein